MHRAACQSLSDHEKPGSLGPGGRGDVDRARARMTIRAIP